MNTVTFTLDPRLATDTLPVMQLRLSELRLMNDSRYLWCILVPRLAGLRDLHDVPEQFKSQMASELDQAAKAVKRIAGAHKMNVAALGNLVEQLHIHVVARQQEDPAWPGPVWGVGKAVPYASGESAALVHLLKQQLGQGTADPGGR